MLKKYNQLLKMLKENGYNVSEFCNHNPYDIECNAIITNMKDEYIDIWLNKESVEIYVYHIDKEDAIEVKEYKITKYAYNFITKKLGRAINFINN